MQASPLQRVGVPAGRGLRKRTDSRRTVSLVVTLIVYSARRVLNDELPPLLSIVDEHIYVIDMLL